MDEVRTDTGTFTIVYVNGMARFDGYFECSFENFEEFEDELRELILCKEEWD